MNEIEFGEPGTHVWEHANSTFVRCSGLYGGCQSCLIGSGQIKFFDYPPFDAEHGFGYSDPSPDGRGDNPS